MTIDTKTHSANIRLRVFQDDFRDAIKNANPDLTSISNEHFLAKRKVEIERYLQQHFQLIFNEKNSPFSLASSQAENDIYWLHFNLVLPKETQDCTLQADYLMELFDDQSNIGTIILNDKKQFFRFTQRDEIFQIALPDF